MNWLESVIGNPGSGPFLWGLVVLAVAWSLVACVLDCREHQKWMTLMERETPSGSQSEEQPGNRSRVAPHHRLAG